MISSVGVGATSSGGTGELYIDKTDDNYGIGENLTFHADAENNIALGANALNNTAGDADENIAIGTSALQYITTGDSNMGIGYQALKNHVEGSRNIAIGHQAMYATNDNIADGSDDNMFIGFQSGSGTWASATSAYNVGIGNLTMIGAMNDANNNTAIGYSALNAATTTDDNTAIGFEAGKALTTGDGNTILGCKTANTVDTMSNSVVIGHNVMKDVPASQALTGVVAIG